MPSFVTRFLIVVWGCLFALSAIVSQAHAEDIQSLLVEQWQRANPATPLERLTAVDQLLNAGAHEAAKEYLVDKIAETRPGFARRPEY